MASFAAQEQKSTYESIHYSTDGWLDPKGYQGVENVQTYFQKVRVNIVVDTDESDEALMRLKEEVERRCPLFNLLEDAGVDVESIWSKI